MEALEKMKKDPTWNTSPSGYGMVYLALGDKAQAYQYFEEDRKGSITEGKQADLVILEADPRTVEPDNLKDLKIIETFSRGRSVHRADAS